jgi:diguanylate cyclase (GGDEF)-like protein/PAS domain S-box-containing protein
MTATDRRTKRPHRPNPNDPGTWTTDMGLVLRTLLADSPDALVAAIDSRPAGGFVDWPAALPMNDHRLLQATSMLDVVIPADRVVVIETWERARAVGAARAPVHLLASPDRAAVLHFLDVRAEYGIFVGVVLPADGETSLSEPPRATGLPPRIARVRKDELAVLVDIDAATTRILGWTQDSVVGHRSLEFIHPDDHERAIQSWLQMLANPAAKQAVRLRHRRADGSWLWMEVSNLNMLEDPSERCVLTEMIDISDEMAAHEALRAREQLLDRLAEALPIGILQIAADRRVVYANDRLGGLLGTGAGASLDEQLASVVAEDRAVLDAAMAAALTDGIDRDVEVRVELPRPSRARRCMVRIRALSDQDGQVNGAIVCVEDVTQSAQLRSELEQQASHDMLTQLLNRRSIMVLLEGALTSASEGGTTVIFVDLDRFKMINDRFGHLAGDELLRIVADRLQSVVRAGDALGRIGGDEFLVVCPDVPNETVAQRLARRVAAALNREVAISGGMVDVRASVGVAYANGRELTSDELVGEADAAMYESKRQGRGRPVTFDRSLAAG